jgi:hypothetical protein
VNLEVEGTCIYSPIQSKIRVQELTLGYLGLSLSAQVKICEIPNCYKLSLLKATPTLPKYSPGRISAGILSSLVSFIADIAFIASMSICTLSLTPLPLLFYFSFISTPDLTASASTSEVVGGHPVGVVVDSI